jgi:hypothetical protein
MSCGKTLGKLPLVSTPFANLAIGERSETIAKLVLSAQQKLSQFHHLPPICQQVARGKFFHFDPRLLSRDCTKLSYLPQHPDVGHAGNSGA